MLEIFMLVNKKFLGQNICNHIFHIAIHQLNKASFSLLLHQMMMNKDMFHASMKDWVF